VEAAVFWDGPQGAAHSGVWTYAGSPWLVLGIRGAPDRARTPVSSERVTITPAGTILVGWIVEVGASRSLRFAKLVHGRWQPSVQLDRGDGLGSFHLLLVEPDAAVVEWHDTVTRVTRHLIAEHTNRSWQSATSATPG
jgi:hypothetical protein